MFDEEVSEEVSERKVTLRKISREISRGKSTFLTISREISRGKSTFLTISREISRGKITFLTRSRAKFGFCQILVPNFTRDLTRFFLARSHKIFS